MCERISALATKRLRYIEVPGNNTHDYLDFELIEKRLRG